MLRGLISQRESIDIYGTTIDSLESSYIRFFEGLGIFLQPVSNFIKDARYLFEGNEINVIILSGGGDVAPECYHNYDKKGQQPSRDMVEKQLIANAIKNDIPILGICRGMQHLNGLYGGKISNLVELNKDRPNGKDHAVTTGKGVIKVNNYHNDGILMDDLSCDFSACAIDSDHCTVEGFFSNKDRILGVQWHPERSFENQDGLNYSESLIKAFIFNGGKLDESYYFSSRTRD